MAHELTINVSDLDAGGKAYHFELRPEWVRGLFEDHEATTSGKPGQLDIRASKSASDVVVHGTLDCTLSIPCARCLKPTELPLHVDLSVLYVPASSVKRSADGESEELELSDEEADTLPYDGDTVALDDLVRDELFLAIPMIPLCSDECPGMSPAPEQSKDEPTEKPVDPRLLPLLRFGAQLPKTGDQPAPEGEATKSESSSSRRDRKR